MFLTSVEESCRVPFLYLTVTSEAHKRLSASRQCPQKETLHNLLSILPQGRRRAWESNVFAFIRSKTARAHF